MTIRPVVFLLSTMVHIIRDHRKYGIFLGSYSMHSFHSRDVILQQGIALIVAEWRTLDEGHRDQCTRHVDQTILRHTCAYSLFRNGVRHPRSVWVRADSSYRTCSVVRLLKVLKWYRTRPCLTYRRRNDKMERFSKSSRKLHHQQRKLLSGVLMIN